MMNTAKQGSLPVIFLTLAISASAVAPATAADRRPAQAPARSAAAAPQQQSDPTLAPPKETTTVRPAVSDSDEAGTLPERIDVQSMKKRYWTVGNEDLMDVVQNRLYTKKGRLETSLKYGTWSDDAFQDQQTIGLSLGYHLSEFFSVHGFYATISSANSQAYTAATDAAGGVVPVVNPGVSVMGAEGRASLVYGKLSILGKAIIYYDLNVAAGVSMHKAKTGSSTGFFGGLGQQFYINKTFFVDTTYRILFHTDEFNKPGIPGTRALTTNWIQFGVGAFF